MSAPEPCDPNQDPNPQEPTPEPRPASEKQQDASRENGKKSQGPKTPEGKARSSQNAVKHGLTAKTTNPDLLVLSDEDREEFNAFQERFINGMAPEDPAEIELLKCMVAANWRMTRIMGIETGLMEKDRYFDVVVPIIIGVDKNGYGLTEPEYRETQDRGLTHSYVKNGGDLERLHKYERMLFNAFHRSLRLFYQNKLTKQKLQSEDKKENSKNEPEPFVKESVIPRPPNNNSGSDVGIPQPEAMPANPPAPQTKEIQNEPKPAAKPQGMPNWEPSPGHPDYKPFVKNRKNEENSKTNPRKHYFTDLFQALTSGILPPFIPKQA